MSAYPLIIASFPSMTYTPQLLDVNLSINNCRISINDLQTSVALRSAYPIIISARLSMTYKPQLSWGQLLHQSLPCIHHWLTNLRCLDVSLSINHCRISINNLLTSVALMSAYPLIIAAYQSVTYKPQLPWDQSSHQSIIATYPSMTYKPRFPWCQHIHQSLPHIHQWLTSPGFLVVSLPINHCRISINYLQPSDALRSAYSSKHCLTILICLEHIHQSLPYIHHWLNNLSRLDVSLSFNHWRISINNLLTSVSL
jgi:hypothetical protein